jgi:3-oxoacyl-[acyl-carrier protein] reductase
MILKDPVAIVTGAGRGIGAATAMALADAGVTVAAVGIESDLVTHTSNAIARRGGRSLALAVDIGDVAAIRSMVDTVMAAFGRVDILGNNGGVTRRAESWT